MSFKNIIFWVLLGLVLIFFDSLYLGYWLSFIGVIILSWRQDNPWFAILILGLLSDIFLVKSLGSGVFYFVLVALLARWFKQTLGLARKDSVVRVSDF